MFKNCVGSQLNSVPTVHSMSQENKSQNTSVALKTLCYLKTSQGKKTILPSVGAFRGGGGRVSTTLTQSQHGALAACARQTFACENGQPKSLSTCGHCPKTNLFTGEVCTQQQALQCPSLNTLQPAFNTSALGTDSVIGRKQSPPCSLTLGGLH